MAAPHRHFCRYCAKALWNFTPQQPKQRGLSVRAALRSSSDAARYIGPIGAGSVAKLAHNCAGYDTKWFWQRCSR